MKKCSKGLKITSILYWAGREKKMEKLNIENSKENPAVESELVEKVKQAQPQEE